MCATNGSRWLVAGGFALGGVGLLTGCGAEEELAKLVETGTNLIGSVNDAIASTNPGNKPQLGFAGDAADAPGFDLNTKPPASEGLAGDLEKALADKVMVFSDTISFEGGDVTILSQLWTCGSGLFVAQDYIAVSDPNDPNGFVDTALLSMGTWHVQADADSNLQLKLHNEYSPNMPSTQSMEIRVDEGGALFFDDRPFEIYNAGRDCADLQQKLSDSGGGGS